MLRNLIQNASAPTDAGSYTTYIDALYCEKCETSSISHFYLDKKKESVEWTWHNELENDFVELLNENRDVKFHRNFSSGTAIVRGSQPLSSDQHFWEIKMISPVYGTDMMVGVGTPQVDMSPVHERFIHLLGIDNQTWGLSYTGQFHHNGESKDYAKRFGQGCVVGVHLDMWNGTLSFYKNKKHLGVATKGLKGKTLYAMACSTAACSSMRILHSCSFPSSLQFLCCAKLRDLIPDDKSVLKALELPPGLKMFLENNLSWLLGSRNQEIDMNKPYLPVKRLCRSRPAQYPPTLEDIIRGSDNIDNDVPVNLCQGSLVRTDSRPYVALSNFNRFSSIRDRDSGPSWQLASDEYISNSEGPQRSNDLPDRDNSTILVQGNSARTLRGTLGSEPNSMESKLVDEDQDKPDLDYVVETRDEGDENEAKRCRYSYNYIMGLSDPDSD